MKQLLKRVLTAIGKAQAFIILSIAYYVLFLPFVLMGHLTARASGWHDKPPHTSTLEQALRQ